MLCVGSLINAANARQSSASRYQFNNAMTPQKVALITSNLVRIVRETMGAAAIRALGKPKHVLYDLKYLLAAGDSDLRL